MIADYTVFIGNRILGWFLLHSSERQSINQLARTLSISPGSVKTTPMFSKQTDAVLLVIG